MNTDACNVEDMNIPQIMEHLSVSCIESSGERFSIFRNRSFTLFRSERDFRERFDSAHLSSLFHSEESDELASVTGFPVHVCCLYNELIGTLWLSDLVFSGVFRCRRDKYDGIPYTTSRYQIRYWPWFCCDSFFICIFLCSFRHRFESINGTEMTDVEQHKRWFRSSRVTLGFVSMSASCFLVSMYLPWTSLICVSSPKCVYMCVKRCPIPNTKCVYMCVTKCVYMCVTKCVYMCVTKCVSWHNGARSLTLCSLRSHIF